MLSRWVGRAYVSAFILVCLVFWLLVGGYKYSFTDFQVSSSHGFNRAISLPFIERGVGAAEYTYAGKLQRGWFGPKTFRFIPDDKILAVEVDGHAVDLSTIDPAQLSDVAQGATITIADYMDGKSHSIVVKVQDFGGDYGLKIEAAWLGPRLVAIIALGFCIFMISALWIFRRIKLPLAWQFGYLFVAFGNIAQVWYIFLYNPIHHIFSDPQRHWEQGTDLLRTDLMALTDPIGYQFYIACLAKFTLELPILVAYCTSLLAVSAPWFWYRFLRELQGNKTAAIWGWAALSCLPSWMSIYGYFMQETLLLPLLGAALWATWRCRRKATLSTFIVMVLLWIAAGLTRGIAIPFAAVCCTWLWVVQDTKLKKAVCSLVVLALILGPLTYRSYQMVGLFAPHGMGHLNDIYAKSGKKVIEIHSKRNGAGWGLWFGSPATGERPFEPFSDWHTQRKGVVRVNVDLAEGSRDWKAAKKTLNFSFSRYLWITKENLIFGLLGSSWPDNNPERVVDVAGLVERWIWIPLFLFTVIATVYYRRELRGQWLLPSLIAAWFIVQLLVPISVNEGRYRKPFEGLLIAQIVLLAAARKRQIKHGAEPQSWDEFKANILLVLNQAKPKLKEPAVQ